MAARSPTESSDLRGSFKDAMTSATALALGLLLAIVVGGAAVAFPSTPASWYARILEPALLFAASVLALWVAAMYRGDMRRVFRFLAVFLLLYGLVNTTSLVDWAAEFLDGNFFRALLAYQLFSYAFLLLAGVGILRVVEVTRLNAWGWVSVAGGVALGVAIVAYAAPTFRDVFGDNVEAAFLYLVIRIFDVLVMVMLIPVVWLYIQNARAKYKESATFAVVAIGVVASLVLAYVYELAKQEPLADLVAEFQSGSVLDALYLFGYVLLTVALIAHRKHQDWSLKQLDRILE